MNSPLLAAAGEAADRRRLLFQQMIDANPVPYFVIDTEHRIVHWSKGCEQILGKPAVDMLGTSNQWMPFYPQQRATLADYIVEDAIEEIIEGLYQDKQVRRSPSIEGAFEAVDFFPGLGGEGLWLHFTAAPLRDVTGKIIGAIETLQDVSLQRKADVQLHLANRELEMEVARRTAELAESNRQLQATLGRAEEINRLKSIFLAAISSELKTPLNGILGFADLIRMDPADENIGVYANEIHDSGIALLGLLNDLLTLSEIAAGQAELPEDQFSPQEIIANVLAGYQEAADRKSLKLELREGSRCPELMVGDAKRLIHIIGCLLDNAVKFTETGSVTVSMDGEADRLLLKISDTGPGIAPEIVASILQGGDKMELFASPRPGCMGLGLALAKAQIAIMNGAFEVVSRPGEGSSFVLSLPSGVDRQ